MAKAIALEIEEDQPTTCPKCAVRTAFTEMDADGTQYYVCLNCHYEFLMDIKEED